MLDFCALGFLSLFVVQIPMFQLGYLYSTGSTLNSGSWDLNLKNFLGSLHFKGLQTCSFFTLDMIPHCFSGRVTHMDKYVKQNHCVAHFMVSA